MRMRKKLALYNVDFISAYYSTETIEEGAEPSGRSGIVVDEIFAAGGLQGFEDDRMGLASEYEDGGMPPFAHVSGEGSYVVLEAAVLEGVNREYLKNRHYVFRRSRGRMCFLMWGIGFVSSGQCNFEPSV